MSNSIVSLLRVHRWGWGGLPDWVQDWWLHVVRTTPGGHPPPLQHAPLAGAYRCPYQSHLIQSTVIQKELNCFQEMEQRAKRPSMVRNVVPVAATISSSLSSF